MDKKVRIGFVGVGGMGQQAHLRNYHIVPECEVVAIAEIRPQLAKRVAEKYHIPKVYSDAGEMLSKEKLDGIVAPQPFTRHGQVLPDLYKSKIPVLTEKPLAGSIEVGEMLLKALRGGGSWHMVGYHKRSDPAVMWAKKEMGRLKETGELGKLKYVRIIMPAGDWVAGGFNDLIDSKELLPPVQWDPPATDMDKPVYDQYVGFVNYYIHQVNLMRHLLGEPYQVKYADPSGVMLAVQSESGVGGVIEMTPYQTSIAWEESALIAYEHGYIKIVLPAPVALNRPGHVEVYYDNPQKGIEPKRVIPTLPWTHAMLQQARNFVGAIKGDNEPPCDAAEALEDLKVAREYIKLWRNK
jgi:predicted dehydrogenase